LDAGNLRNSRGPRNSRQFTEHIVNGCGVLGAVVGVFKKLEQAAGTVIPNAAIGGIDRGEVSIEETITQL